MRELDRDSAQTKQIFLTCFLASQAATFAGSLGIAIGASVATNTSYHSLFLFYIYSAYSWLVVTPVCLLMAAPLKLMVEPRWGWIKQTLVCALVGGALALVAGYFLGALNANRGEGNVLSTAAAIFGIGAYYAGIFGLTEWWFTRRFDRKREDKPVLLKPDTSAI